MTYDKSILLRVDTRELATILAALRYHQDENLHGAIGDARVADIATDSGTVRPLSASEVDTLCRRLNLLGGRGGRQGGHRGRRGHGMFQMFTISMLMLVVTAVLITLISGSCVLWLPTLAAIVVLYYALVGRRR